MPSNLQPADYVAAFTWARLIAVAKILFEVRLWVAENATPERGDSRTGIGFRAWEQCKHAVTLAAANDFPWLSVKDGSARFLFVIGGVPIRFYRGDSDEPVPENYADPDEVEREQLALGLSENGGVEFDGYYRVIVHADAAGYPLGVFLAGVGFDDNTIRMAWEIPFRADASGASSIIVPMAPVPLPPLSVLTVAEAGSAAREEAEREEREREAKKRANDKDADTESKGA